MTYFAPEFQTGTRLMTICALNISQMFGSWSNYRVSCDLSTGINIQLMLTLRTTSIFVYAISQPCINSIRFRVHTQIRQNGGVPMRKHGCRIRTDKYHHDEIDTSPECEYVKVHVTNTVFMSVEATETKYRTVVCQSSRRMSNGSPRKTFCGWLRSLYVSGENKA